MTLETSTIPLLDVIKHESDSADNKALSAFMNDLNYALTVFKCKNSVHHEEFLREKAISLEEKGASRTYLILNTEYVEKSVNLSATEDDKRSLIAGYYTIGISCIANNKWEASKRVRKILRNEPFPQDGSIGCYVIGELCRSDMILKDDLSGEKILSECLGKILESVSVVGGSLIRVDSRQSVLNSLYSPFGFLEVETTGNSTIDGESLITSVLKIDYSN